MSMHIMPAKPGTCPVCAVVHAPDQPHNQQSLFYQMRFNGSWGRWPTWADAVAHCKPELAAAWKNQLEKGGHWSDPPEGVEPIAEWPEGIQEGAIPMRGMGPIVVAMNRDEEPPER